MSRSGMASPRAGAAPPTPREFAQTIADAIQPAGKRKAIYELRLTNPRALQHAAERADEAQTIIASIQTDDPKIISAIDGLSQAIGHLRYAADLINPDEFGDYEGDAYLAAQMAQSDIESAADHLRSLAQIHAAEEPEQTGAPQ